MHPYHVGRSEGQQQIGIEWGGGYRPSLLSNRAATVSCSLQAFEHTDTEILARAGHSLDQDSSAVRCCPVRIYTSVFHQMFTLFDGHMANVSLSFAELVREYILYLT